MKDAGGPGAKSRPGKAGGMKIKEITSQIRRDFTAIYVCEHCGHEEEGHGYDDTNFHANVIPNMKCSRCGKKASISYQPRQTKYPDSMVV